MPPPVALAQVRDVAPEGHSANWSLSNIDAADEVTYLSNDLQPSSGLNVVSNGGRTRPTVIIT